jgi:hypothetical protein
MLTLIYLGERFEAETNGYFGTFTDQATLRGVTWVDVQDALMRGEAVAILQATSEYLAACESVLAIYKANGGRDVVPVVDRVH